MYYKQTAALKTIYHASMWVVNAMGSCCRLTGVLFFGSVLFFKCWCELTVLVVYFNFSAMLNYLLCMTCLLLQLLGSQDLCKYNSRHTQEIQHVGDDGF